MNRKWLRRMSVPIIVICAGLANCSGKTSNASGPATAYAVLRLTPANGAVDAGFAGGRGIAITDVDPALFDFALAVAIEPAPSNKIIVAGSSGLSGQGVIALVRYNTDGSLDTTFGTGGIVKTTVPSLAASGTAIAVQPADNKIVVGALTFNASTGNTGIAVLRYTPSGALDTTTFNALGTVPGIVTAAIGPGSAGDTCALALQGTNIIVAGASSNGNIVLYRYDNTGALDMTFGTSGVASTNLGSPAMSPAIALQADSKIVVAGGKGSFSTSNQPVDQVVLRYTADGMLDTTTFGAAGPTPGIVTTDINLLGNFGNAVVVQPADGKIVVAGHANVNFQTDASDISLVRYNADGSLDTLNFGAGTGIVTTDLGRFDNALSVALQADSRIVVSGNTGSAGLTATAVLRYNTDGSPDTNFGLTNQGNVIVQLAGPSTVASGNAVVVQSDGKIVVAGYD